MGNSLEKARRKDHMKKMLIAVIVIGVFGFIGFGIYENILTLNQRYYEELV